MAQAGAAAQAVYTQGSCARLMLETMEAQSGLGQAETGVPARARMRRATAKAEALVAQSCRARTMAVVVTAATEAETQGYGKSWERQGDLK